MRLEWDFFVFVKMRGEYKMNRMKKLAVCVLALCLALSLFGCGAEDIYSEYRKAVEKTNGLESLDVTMNMKMDIATSGMTISAPMEARVRGIQKNGKPEEMLVDMTMSLMGQEVTASMYYKDGVCYTATQGVKVKESMSADAFQADSGDVSIPEFPEDILKQATRTQENGESKVSVTFDGEKTREILLDMIASSLEDGGLQMTELKLSDVDFSYTINKDGYVSEYAMKFNMSGKSNQADASVAMDIQMRFRNPGEKVSIQAPDLSQYVDSSDLGW